MKIEFTEHGGCFAFDIKCETMADTVALSRFALGKTKELRSAQLFFDAAGGAELSIVIGKRQNATTSIP